MNVYYSAPQPMPEPNPTETEEDTPVSQSVTSEFDSDIPDSIIFTKKAKKEGRIPTIIQSLQQSMERRKDKTRAFVEELRSWQKEGYVDAHYNARVMYDEWNKISALTFEYDTFRKYYNGII
jgi:hypothetical protein